MYKAYIKHFYGFNKAFPITCYLSLLYTHFITMAVHNIETTSRFIEISTAINTLTGEAYSLPRLCTWCPFVMYP